MTEKLAYRIPEACERTGMGRTTMFAEIRAGRLDVVRVGRITLIPHESLQKYLRENIARRPTAGRTRNDDTSW